MSKKEGAGAYVRRVRDEKNISLRQFAKQIEKTPTFVSRFERGEDIRPSEETLRTMARVLNVDADELIFLAERVPSDLPEIVQRYPAEMAALLRTAQNLNPEQLKKLTKEAQKQSEKD